VLTNDVAHFATPQEADFASLGRTARLFLMIVLLVIFEGAIRKWLIPALGTPLMLLRDFFAVCIVIDALSRGTFGRAPVLFESLLIWSGVVLIWGLIQLLILQTPVWIFILGVRFWLLYLWMALAVAVGVSNYEMRFVIKVMLWILLGMAPLAVVQFLMPAGHWINYQPDTEEEKIFTSALGVVRTSGTFSFTLGYTCFIAMTLPFALVGAWHSVPIFSNRFIGLLISVALVVASLVSGSRGALLFFLFMAFIFLALELVYSRNAEGKLKSALWGGMLFSVAMVFLIIFPDLIFSMQERFLTASDSEDFLSRIFVIFLGEPEALAKFDFLGQGLGAGSNAASALLTGQSYFMLAESEAGRVLLEMGLLGGVWIFIKFAMIVVGLFYAERIARIRGDVLPLVLWISIAYGVLTWAISGQISAHGVFYIMMAFGLNSLFDFKVVDSGKIL